MSTRICPSQSTGNSINSMSDLLNFSVSATYNHLDYNMHIHDQDLYLFVPKWCKLLLDRYDMIILQIMKSMSFMRYLFTYIIK